MLSCVAVVIVRALPDRRANTMNGDADGLPLLPSKNRWAFGERTLVSLFDDSDTQSFNHSIIGSTYTARSRK